MEPTCEERQIALEMVRHGARPALDLAALERHLVGCAACAAVAEASGRVDAMIDLAPATMDLAPLRDRVRASRARDRLVLPLLLVPGGLSLGYAWYARSTLGVLGSVA